MALLYSLIIFSAYEEDNILQGFYTLLNKGGSVQVCDATGLNCSNIAWRIKYFIIQQPG